MVIVSGLLILNPFMNKTITGNTLPDSLISIFPAWAFCQMCFSSIAIAGQFSPGLNLTQVYKTRQATQRNHRRLAADVLHRMDNAVLPPPRAATKPNAKVLQHFLFHQLAFFLAATCWPLPNFSHVCLASASHG